MGRKKACSHRWHVGLFWLLKCISENVHCRPPTSPWVPSVWGEQPEALVTPPRTKKLSIPMNTNGQNTTGVQWKRRWEQRIDGWTRGRQRDRGVQVNVDHIEATHHSFPLSILSPSFPNKMTHRNSLTSSPLCTLTGNCFTTNSGDLCYS